MLETMVSDVSVIFPSKRWSSIPCFKRRRALPSPDQVVVLQHDRCPLVWVCVKIGHPLNHLKNLQIMYFPTMTHRIHVCYNYMVTYTINIPPMLAYIPYMDPIGDCIKSVILGPSPWLTTPLMLLLSSFPIFSRRSRDELRSPAGAPWFL